MDENYSEATISMRVFEDVKCWICAMYTYRLGHCLLLLVALGLLLQISLHLVLNELVHLARVLPHKLHNESDTHQMRR